MDEEAKLVDKLRRIEALFAGATTKGERSAAESARHRILERLRRVERESPPVEFKLTMPDVWSRKVLVALLRRYGLKPYRYPRQRHTTVMVRAPRQFIEETVWPEFEQISRTLDAYLQEVTDRVVHQVLHRDSSDAEVVAGSAPLPGEDR
mgnify:CR=1 FL=1